MNRQKLVGWILIVVAAGFLAYFLRVRLFAAGPMIEKKEWVQVIGSIIVLMIGTVNVRLAAMRKRDAKGSST